MARRHLDMTDTQLPPDEAMQYKVDKLREHAEENRQKAEQLRKARNFRFSGGML